MSYLNNRRYLILLLSALQKCVWRVIFSSLSFLHWLFQNANINDKNRGSLLCWRRWETVYAVCCCPNFFFIFFYFDRNFITFFFCCASFWLPSKLKVYSSSCNSKFSNFGFFCSLVNYYLSPCDFLAITVLFFQTISLLLLHCIHLIFYF